MNRNIIACGQNEDIGTRVILWDEAGGYACPHPRGRSHCTLHDPALNDAPTRSTEAYVIQNPPAALAQLRDSVYQFVLHYDCSYCSRHCHQWMEESDFKGSHFYLDLDGTIYQTCDLYWKTNTAPADDRQGNERAVHVEISNLSWEARKADSELYRVPRDQYRHRNGKWELHLPDHYRDTLRTPGFRACAARGWGKRGYFSRRINGRVVRMWDFTEEQYQALIRLCIGVHRLLPRIKLEVPYQSATRRTPLDRLPRFATFQGILGHAHVQAGAAPGLAPKYDPGSAFDWSRLRKAFRKYLASR